MEISEKANELVEDINNYSNKFIKNSFEISALILTTQTAKKQKEFKDLIFTGKYVNGLRNVLSNKTITGDEYMEKIFKEFNKNLQIVIELLKNIISVSDEKTKKYFNKKYFLLNQESMANIISLIEDLSICKEYFNENKSRILDS